MDEERAVLAYSGGLDTSVILHYMVRKKGYDVVAFIANIGQDENFEKAREKALKIGASEVRVVDCRREFVTDFIFPVIRANAKYEGRYLMGTSIARPLIAMRQVEVAKEVGATVLSHGSTGKGNDQVRFELGYHTLYLSLFPEARIYAPHKDPEFLKRLNGGSRDAMMEYAEENGIPITQTKKKPWSSDENFMHISYEAGMLEDPAVRYLEDMFKMTVSPKDAPDKETLIDIEFEKGNPVKVTNLEDGTVKVDPVELFDYLNKIAGANGVKRVDMVENRYVGMKSRGVYETPGTTVLQEAHRDLEGLTMDREVMLLRDMMIPKYAERVYSGYWFSPEMELLRTFMDKTQEYVTGIVTVALYKGNCDPVARRSAFSLYDEKIASMHEKGQYDPTDAKGFININAIRLKASEKRKKKLE